MNKIILVFLLVFILILGSGCDKTQYRKLDASGSDFSSNLGTDTPEGIARATGLIYMQISEGKLSVDEAMEKLTTFSSIDAQQEISKYKDKFRQGIEDFIDYSKEKGDKIVKIEFSKTVYDNTKEAHIERIQYHKSNNKRYYFTQDFVMEDGAWRVRGDNMADPFKISNAKSKKYVLK